MVAQTDMAPDNGSNANVPDRTAFEYRRRSRTASPVWKFMRRKPLGFVAGCFIFLLAVVGIVAPWISPHNPETVSGSQRLKPPSRSHLLGTDNLGRDVFSRLLVGTRTSMYVSATAVVAAGMLGVLVGLTSGYFGGKYDILLQRFLDVMMSIPAIVLALAIVAVRGPSTSNVILAIAVVQVPTVSRVVRSSAISIKSMPYVEAAHVVGAGDVRLLLRHFLPNAMAPLIIIASASFAGALLTESSLSYLGVGTPPTTPSWGSLMSGAARQFLAQAPWLAISAGTAIAVAVLSINIFGDSLRDVIDPRLRQR